jgi:lipase chaperone LimK
LAERESIARETLGKAWRDAFFGSEWARAYYDLERMQIAHDIGLTAEQKAARVQALDQMTPLDVRAALERERGAQARMDTIAELESRHLPPDQLRAFAAQAVGAQAAERIVRMRQEEDTWRAKYAAYAGQRAQIEAAGGAPAQREARAAQLRERLFANAGERARAALLDANSGG